MIEKRNFFEEQDYRDMIGASLSSRHLKVINIAEGFFNGKSVKRILDIGCLDGTYSIILGKHLYANEVHGVDISEANVINARGKGCEALVFDLDSGTLPFSDASFDFIHVGDIIEHLYNPDNLLREIRRLLTIKGICIVTTPNLAALANRIALLFGYQPFPVGTSLEHDTGKLFISNPLLLGSHIRVFTYRAFVQLCRIYNLKVVKAIGMPLSTGGQQQTGVRIVGSIERTLLAPTLYKMFPSLAWDLLYVLKTDTSESK